jgi:MFS family permease
MLVNKRISLRKIYPEKVECQAALRLRSDSWAWTKLPTKEIFYSGGKSDRMEQRGDWIFDRRGHMQIGYFEPLGRAWNRMKAALFKPFDLQKWFYFGFSAFLAGLAAWNNASVTSRWSDRGSFREFIGFPDRAWRWLVGHPVWFMVIAFGILILIVLGIVILWLSSRGMFMFLDNVVRDKAEIADPWKRFKGLANSLFRWRLIFVLIGLLLSFLLMAFFYMTAAHFYESRGYYHIHIGLGLVMGLAFLVLMILIAFISGFLKDFVVPIMYKNNIKAVPAWRHFLSLFGQHPLPFILYGLLMIVLFILFIVVVVFAGLITCCIGWFLLAIPYIGTVVTLPVWYIFRAFSLEFLAQFGPEYELFPRPGTPPEGARA